LSVCFPVYPVRGSPSGTKKLRLVAPHPLFPQDKAVVRQTVRQLFAARGRAPTDMGEADPGVAHAGLDAETQVVRDVGGELVLRFEQLFADAPGVAAPAVHEGACVNNHSLVEGAAVPPPGRLEHLVTFPVAALVKELDEAEVIAGKRNRSTRP